MSPSKIAYLILAHTDALHLEKLVNAIDYQARIFIHLDAKTKFQDFENLKLPKSAEFITDRVQVAWGGLSIVKATLNLIKVALESETEFSHLVLLSGQDYPIKSPQTIHNFLTSQPNKQFIRFVDMTTSPEYHMERILRYWFWEPFLPMFPMTDRYIRIALLKFLHLFYPILSKKPLEHITPAFGSQWWAITPNCAAYILQFLDKNQNFLDFYRYAHAPDEHFFHTIIANSPYLAETDGFEECRNCGPHKLSNLHMIPVSLNKIHQEEDFAEIMMSNKFFVRKITSVESSRLVKLIDKNL